MRAIVPSVCPPDCPSQCALQVTVDSGRITDVVGDPTHPFTQGVICGKVHDYAERVYGNTRVSTPLRRVGPKGEGRFEPIGWDEALDEIAHRWRRIIAQWGPEALLPFSYGGTLGIVQVSAGHPLFHALGASRLERTICVSTAYAGWRATLGAVTGSDSEQMVDSDLIVLWGINASHTHINAMTLVKRARRRGAFVVCIDPYRTDTARRADRHLMPRPGTDGALALGMMHVLIGEGRVGAADIPRATSATHRRCAPGRSRHDNGGMTCRTIACLPALTGAYAHPNGGALLSSGGAFGLRSAVVERPDLMPDPPPRSINMIRLGRALTDPDARPPVKALYVYNANPATVVPNQEMVLEGLRREDLFTVVHEQHLTDTTDYADLVLPATTSMEHTDCYKSYGHLYLQLARPVIPPEGLARSNWRVTQDLARAMGLRDPHFAKSEADLIREILASGDDSVAGITLERLEGEHSIRLQVGRPYLPFADGAPTPSGKVEFLSETLAREGLPALPTYVPLVEGPEHTALLERYPLQCIVPPNPFFLHSSFSQSERMRRRQRGPAVLLHPADAAPRAIRGGDAVVVRSARGQARFTAEVTEDTRAGGAVVEGIWWSEHQAGGRGVNALTDDRVTDMGGGPALHSNLVQVERLGGEP